MLYICQAVRHVCVRVCVRRYVCMYVCMYVRVNGNVETTELDRAALKVTS